MEQFEFENKKRKRLRKEPFYIAISVICLIIGGCLGFYLGSPKQSKEGNSNIYEQIAEIVEGHFYDTTDSSHSLQERMLMGMVAGLGDQYTSYMTSEQANDLTSTINGSFEGIGVSFTTIPSGGLVLETFKGSPADQVGILAGDIITHVQGTSVEGYDSTKIKEMILGEKGTQVFIQILRDGKEKTFQVKRESVESSVGYEIKTEGKKKIGYLRITTFGDTTASLVEKALNRFEEEKIKSICIDLRGNGGGSLEAARELLDLFIDEGQLMFKVQYAENDYVQDYEASDIKKYHFDQGYILVNKDTASASEIMTSALSEILEYKIVGEKTYGKGIVQSQMPLSQAATLKITTARWLTPKGNWINGKGISPNYRVTNLDINDYINAAEMKKNYQYDQVDYQIENMQKVLKLLGYSIDRTDGYFSLKTQEALKKFEKDYGLKVDGIYNKNDYSILTSALTNYIYQKATDHQYQKVVSLSQS